MHLSENEGIEGKAFVVTGGLGFVGSSLCLELVRRGARLVRAFDVRSNSPWSHLLLNNGVHLLKGDIINRKDVDKALRGVDCVFHLASFGMSGKEMLQYGRVDDVNINGTCHVLEACHQYGVKRLVYASTSNVVFAGNEIVNGNEKLPYVLLDNHVDPYSRSKSIAEQLVLKSNGRPLKDKNGECLYTCAVRPAAIYGPGEERHLPRIINLAKLGLLPFKIGEPNVKSDWVYIDNLVLALILASMGLLDDIPGRGKQPVAAGQPYFISDGSPVNTFEFLLPLLKSLEYDMPKATLPVSTALFVGKVFSVIYTVMYPWLNRNWLPQPLLLPAEVYKVGVTHYFNYLKAKQELGYTPITSPQEGMAATISFYQERKRKNLDGPTIYAWFFCVFGMSAVIGAAFFPVPVLRPACLFIIRSLWALRVLAIWAIAMHVGESIYAWRLAKRVDPANARGWALQTLVLGGFSLKFLLKRAKQLGYTPITSPQEGMAATISFYQERKRESLDGPTIYEWFFCVFGVWAVIGAAFFPVPILRPACLFIIRSLWALRVLAISVIAAHVGESIYAWRLAKRVDPANARGWFLQTFVLGIFSLKFLLKRAKQ